MASMRSVSVVSLWLPIVDCCLFVHVCVCVLTNQLGSQEIEWHIGNVKLP